MAARRLARLFSRDSSIDRHEVEVAVERLTQDVLDEVGPLPVGQRAAHAIAPPRLGHPRVGSPHPAAVHRPYASTCRRLLRHRRRRPSRPVATALVSPSSAPPSARTLEPVTVEAIAHRPRCTARHLPATPSRRRRLEVSPFSAPPVAADRRIATSSHSARTGARRHGRVAEAVVAGRCRWPRSRPPMPPRNGRTLRRCAPESIQPRRSQLARPAEAGNHDDVGRASRRQTWSSPRPIPRSRCASRLRRRRSAGARDSATRPTAAPDAGPRCDIDPTLDARRPSTPPASANDTGTSARHRRGERHRPRWTTRHRRTTRTRCTKPTGRTRPIRSRRGPRPAQNLAAVEIWEMVDEMLAEEQSASELVTAGGPPEQRGGRWRRGKKG